MTFHVGQKVVCVDDGIDDPRPWAADIPVVGAIYTVVRVFLDNDPMIGDLLALELAEIKNTKTWDYGFAARRFRPLIERKTDIGFAHEILRKVSSKRSVDA